MKRSLISLGLLVIGFWLLILSSFWFLWAERSYAASISANPTCDLDSLARQEADFGRMQSLRAQFPGLFSEAEYRIAALNYILKAEQCYHAAVPKGQNDPEPIQIDGGGLWAPGSRLPEARFDTDDPNEEGLAGAKWDPTGVYTYSGGANVPGPRRSGGVVTYSYMPAKVKHADNESKGENVSVLTGLGLGSRCVRQKIATAFAAWSAVAHIQFIEVQDNGRAAGAAGASGDIRIGAHRFVITPTFLAHAFFPPAGGSTTLAGDIHLNTDPTNKDQERLRWVCGKPKEKEINIGLVVLHEIGHAIGLNHELDFDQGGDITVMNKDHNKTLTLLQPDDIEGITSIYGQPPQLDTNLCISTSIVTYTFEEGAEGWTTIDIPKNNWVTPTLTTTFWFAPNTPFTSTLATLKSPIIPAKSDAYFLRFRHKFETEQELNDFYEGGNLQIVTAANQPVYINRSHFLKNAYNASTVLGFEEVGSSAESSAFAGDSGSRKISFEAEPFIESDVSLIGLVKPGETFRVYFRFVTDSKNRAGFAGGGWAIDEVLICELDLLKYYLPLIFKTNP